MSLLPDVISNFKSIGEMRLDIGPGDTKRRSANLVKPGSYVGVGEGRGGVGVCISVGTEISVAVAVGVKALVVAKAACPVRATTVGR